jgi:ADP-ribose pyrophosphatase YjhB (NUDIX family)
MAISPYVRDLRSRVGTARLLLPSVSAHVFDSARRLLLVRQRDSAVWSTPGGTIEPDELPADAVMRETWEETGLVVKPRQLLAVFGGPDFLVHYPNGDEAQYVITAFGCEVTGGVLQADSDEIASADYFKESDAAALPLALWLRRILHSVFNPLAQFEPPRWLPPSSARPTPGA